MFEGANGARGFGLVASPDTIETLFDGIYLDAGIGIELHAGPQSRMAVTHLADYIKTKGIDPATCDIRFGLDPIGATAVWGTSAYNWWEMAPGRHRHHQEARRARLQEARSPSPTAASSTMPAAPKCRNCPTSWR